MFHSKRFTSNLPELLTCLSEQDQKRNLGPFTELLGEIYHNVKAGGTDKVQCVVHFDDKKRSNVRTPEEYGKIFVNALYQDITMILEKNPDLTFEEICESTEMLRSFKFIDHDETKHSLSPMIEEIYHSVKINGGTDDIRCHLSFIFQEDIDKEECTI